MKKRLYTTLLWAAFLCISSLSYGQSTVKGTVKATDNDPLVGASVVADGTTTGTVTDTNGNYSLAVPANSARLVFSFVGFERKVIDIKNQTVIDVILAESSALEEIVVTGSTIKTKRRELGNATTSVKGEDLEQSGTGNLFGALQGKVPGAQISQNSGDPSGGISIRLRGVKSLQGSSDPLYVIDGVIVSNASTNVSQLSLGGLSSSALVGTNRMADINPNDIESINIINGAAAAAQYGSRAANGVVLITTKRGKSGKPRFTFTTSYNSNEIRKKLFITTYGKHFGPTSVRGSITTSLSPAQVTANPGTTTTAIIRDGATFNLASNLIDVTRYDYQDLFFRKAQGTDNSLSVNGGNDKTQYAVSASFMKNQGIMLGTDFQRYGLRARVDQYLTDWAKLSVGIAYNNSFSNEKANGNALFSPIGSTIITNNIYNIATDRDASGNLKAVDAARINPLSTVENANNTNNVNRTINNMQLNLTPVAGLSVDFIVGLDIFSQLGNSFIKPLPYASGVPANRWPNGYISSASNTSRLLNTDLNVTYEKDLTDDLKLTTIVGGSYQNSRIIYNGLSGIGYDVERELKGEVPRGYNLAQFPIEQARVEDGSYTKLREISLSYQFPKLIKSLSNLRLGIIGRNLISWDKYSGYDPETSAGGNSDLQRGLDLNNSPIPKTFQVQLSASF